LGAGLISDVFKDHERGKMVSWYACVSLYCMAGSPFVGGAVTQYLGWRSIFWGFVILYGILWFTIILLLPETNLSVRQRSIRCHDNIETCNDGAVVTTKKYSLSNWKKKKMINPFASLTLLAFPNMLICCSYLGWMGFSNNAISLSFTYTYSDQYKFSSTLVGLFYLVGIIGSTAGTYLSGRVSDRSYMHQIEMANMRKESIFPEMRLNQTWQLVAGFFLCGSFTVYGWSIEKNVHFSAGIIIQFGFTIANSFITVYAIQSFPKHGSSAQGKQFR
ncbi:major facilitator superfamily domain-containing protein, partial [Phascolomyces articulosus]